MSNVQYLKASPADFDELLDFANYVFKIDFLDLLPKLYKKEYNTAPCHYIVKDDGRIKAAVGSFPMELIIGGEELAVRGIGTVSVHPYTRRSGYMKALMIAAMEDMRRDGVDMACLGGMRQRYAYFSFEPCGTHIEFLVHRDNLRHCYGGKAPSPLQVRKLTADDDALPAVKALHDAQPLRVTRSDEQFFDILCSWSSTPYVLLEAGKPVGYFVADAKFKEINEFTLQNPAQAEDAVRAIFATYDPDQVAFSCAPWEREIIDLLESVAERYHLLQNECFTVLNFERVLRALLRLKATYTTLADGELTLRVDGKEGVKITVVGGVPAVEAYDGPCEVELPHLEAMRFLFSPAAQYLGFAAKVSPAARSWLPLPLYYPKQDNT